MAEQVQSLTGGGLTCESIAARVSFFESGMNIWIPCFIEASSLRTCEFRGFGFCIWDCHWLPGCCFHYASLELWIQWIPCLLQGGQSMTIDLQQMEAANIRQHQKSCLIINPQPYCGHFFEDCRLVLLHVWDTWDMVSILKPRIARNASESWDNHQLLTVPRRLE